VENRPDEGPEGKRISVDQGRFSVLSLGRALKLLGNLRIRGETERKPIGEGIPRGEVYLNSFGTSLTFYLGNG